MRPSRNLRSPTTSYSQKSRGCHKIWIVADVVVVVVQNVHCSLEKGRRPLRGRYSGTPLDVAACLALAPTGRFKVSARPGRMLSGALSCSSIFEGVVSSGSSLRVTRRQTWRLSLVLAATALCVAARVQATSRPTTLIVRLLLPQTSDIFASGAVR